jgi:hypothetical protein
MNVQERFLFVYIWTSFTSELPPRIESSLCVHSEDFQGLLLLGPHLH